MKASNLDAPLQIHCEGKALLCLRSDGELVVQTLEGRLLVRFTHVDPPPTACAVAGPLAEMAEEFAAEPKPKRSPRKRSPAVNHGSD